MLTHETTRRFLSAYADREPWKADHDEARLCLELEERMAWGITLYKGLLSQDARVQSLALRGWGDEAVELLEAIPRWYQSWVETSSSLLELAREFSREGYEVSGIDAFAEAFEEARSLVGNIALEPQIRPLDELIRVARPGNPNPGRYGI